MKHTIAAIIIVIVMSVFIHTASAVTISVEPSYLEVFPEDEFTVNIAVDPAGTEVMGAQYWLLFDNILLQGLSQKDGMFLRQDGANTNVYSNETNNTIGRVRYGETRMGVNYGVTSPGTLATITFKAMEQGVSSLNLSKVKLTKPDTQPIPDVLINNGTVEIIQPSTPFLINGYISYKNGTKCNNPSINITNLNSGVNWLAETSAISNYYQLVLSSGTDINATEVLQFEVTNPDGSQSNTTCHTVTLEETNNGGLFNFNITLEAKPGIFDTEAPDNPYPSIMGVHNGTITSDRLIEANKIYTYSCPGTGGHTEFVRIWGKDVDAHANWSGYVGEWHNLTFNTTFTIEPGVKYNYTIRTGSYPQIHHIDELKVDNGTIKCTSFIDANGRSYNNWIPAFRLWREGK